MEKLEEFFPPKKGTRLERGAGEREGYYLEEEKSKEKQGRKISFIRIIRIIRVIRVIRVIRDPLFLRFFGSSRFKFPILPHRYPITPALTVGEAGDRLIPFDDTIHERRP